MNGENLIECFICKDEQAKFQFPPESPSIADYCCPRCRNYTFDPGFEVFLESIPKDDESIIKISGWISDENRKGLIPRLNKNKINAAINRPIPTVSARAERLLLEALSKQENLFDGFNATESRFRAATYSKNNSDVLYLAMVLADQDFIKRLSEPGNYFFVRPNGHNYAENLRFKVGSSTKGFVAMWFDRSLNRIYDEGFDFGIRNAGYNPVRIDRKEHANRIDDEIIAEIRSSAFVVADFTGHRGGVYFEAGFALGLNIPVIWTCRESDLTELHFDVRQYNVIIWKMNATDELASRLQLRIEAILGKGPLR